MVYKDKANVSNLTATDGATVTLYAKWTPISYTIYYHLYGGELPSEESNPASYNVETNTFTLVNPTRMGYDFTGWTGSNGSTPRTTVTIKKGSTENLHYTAHYEILRFTEGSLSYQCTSGTEVKVTACDPAATSVTVPATVSYDDVTYSVTAIEATAFAACTSLLYAFIWSATPPALGANAFDACTALTYIGVPLGSAEAYTAATGWAAYGRSRNLTFISLPPVIRFEVRLLAVHHLF